MTRTVRSRRAEVYHLPLYARMLQLRHLAPSSLLCFVFLEGAVVLGILLALAELVSWWGVLVLPLTVALMVKFNDLIAGTLTQPPVATETTTARASVLRPAAMAETHGAGQMAGSAPEVEQRMTGPGFGFPQAGSSQAGAVFGFPGSEQTGFDQPGLEQPGFEQAGFERAGFEQAEFQQAGFEQSGFDRAGFESSVYEEFGSDRSGFRGAGARQMPGGYGFAGPNSGDAYGEEHYTAGQNGFVGAGSGYGAVDNGHSAVHDGHGAADDGYAPAAIGHGAVDDGYGPVQPAVMPAGANYTHAGDESNRAGAPASSAAPVRRQWAEQLDVRQQMARHSAARRYE
ncbi:hypothetical protein AB0F72_35580 [Actinoplanes sp. NPDC023936]|uniref:hypothetical protein n=1 Tax=Actinoplanes sp. NPDC023936 TaxID=3154910 RepID=UPI0034017A14